jgi:putative phosphoribosyl transferase
MKPHPVLHRRDVVIPEAAVSLPGTLVLPEPCAGLVLFAHGSGSSRRSPRNQYVASVLEDAGLGTLLFDLLTGEEGADRSLVFDIPFLAERLLDAVRFVKTRPATSRLPVGLFGASTGAAAALVAAAQEGRIGAVVSRGGRPDLANGWLDHVEAPTLLIVGSHDIPVIAMNRDAMARMHAPRELVLVPGATHLFEQPGTLEEAARLARDWFLRHLPAGGAS